MGQRLAGKLVFISMIKTPAILVLISLLTTLVVWAKPPRRELKNWYDKEQTQLKEVFYVRSEKGKTILDSIYQSYYQDGTLKVSGEYKDGKQTDVWKYFYENGSLKAIGNYDKGTQQGHWQYYYESGKLSSEGNLEKGQKEGLWFFYFENGKQKSFGEFADGKQSGTWTYYYEDGAKKGEAAYDETGLAIYKEYFTDGKLKATGFLKNGQSDSTWTYYFPNGKLKAKGKEHAGFKQGRWEYYYENGQLSSVGNENHGQREGQWNLFYESGKSKGQGNFVNGDGNYQEYYENGALKVEGPISRGKNNGDWVYYHEDGTLEGKASFVAGEGVYKGYYKSGQLKMEGLIKDGQKVGSWKLYKEDGQLAGYYKNYYELENPPGNDSSLVESTQGSEGLANKNTELKEDKEPSKDKLKRKKMPGNYSLILSANPFAIFLKSMPVYLEIYEDKHWGYELEAITYRSPFFNSHNNLPNNEIASYGAALGIRQKRYQKKKSDIGRPYIAQGFRYIYMDYRTHVMDLNTMEKSTLNMTGNSFEYTVQIGDRLLKSYRKSGLAFDVYAGIGVGYRFFSQNWSEKVDYDILFSGIPQESWYLPLRFGFSLGYRF